MRKSEAGNGIPVIEPKFFKDNNLNDGISARGGLEPHFRVLFSAIFQGFTWGISISVENSGMQWKQNCCKLLQVYLHFLR